MQTVYPWLIKYRAHLMQQHAAQRFPQALMLCGQAGLGKFDLAVNIAQTLLCVDQGEQACGACKSCQLFQSHSHPDFTLIQREDKSRVIKVEQLRGLIGRVSQTPSISGRQVVLIEPLEAMHHASANALLKVLEEPPGQVHFLLVCHRQGMVLPTIVSRCQRMNIAIEDESAVISWLQSVVPNCDHLQLLLQLADQSPLRARDLYTEKVVTLRDEVMGALVAIQSDKVHPVTVATQWVKGDLFLILRLIFSIYLDLMKLQVGLLQHCLVHRDMILSLRSLLTTISVQQCQCQLSKIIEATRLLERGMYLNPQLVLENILC